MSEPGSREGGRPQLRGGPRLRRLAGVTQPGTRRRRGRAGPRRAFSREALEAESTRVQGPEEGGVSADPEKGKEEGKQRMHRGPRSKGVGRRRGEWREKQSRVGGRRGRLQPRRGRRAGEAFSQSRGPPGDAEPCDQPAAAQTASPPRPTALPKARMKNGNGKWRSRLPTLGNQPRSKHT